MENRTCPRLCIVIPCYNEEIVLPITAPQFLQKIEQLIADGLVAPDSRVLFVDDGSRDGTWPIIRGMASRSVYIRGMSLSRNRGHQNALLAGLMEVRDRFDIVISIDCDGQDDIHAMDAMVRAYLDGADVVYGVRSNRDTDTVFKRFTAENFYKLLDWLGVEVVFNHADYRLASSRVLRALADFDEANLFLRGLFPLIGFRSETVFYARIARKAGESHYPLRRMLSLALEGIVGFSLKPIRALWVLGGGCMLLALIGLLVSIICAIAGKTGGTAVWMLWIVSFFSGLLLCGMGVLGEYVGRAYAETKGRPRYIVAERTWTQTDA